MLANKHLLLAFVVGPLLAIAGWYGVDQLVGEQATPAQAGQTYKLLAKSNCRYASGVCSLENEDFKLRVTAAPGELDEKIVALDLQSEYRLQAAFMAVGQSDTQLPPQPMTGQDSQGLQWRLEVNIPPGPDDRIYLVVRAAGVMYYGEAATTFLDGGKLGDVGFR